MPFARPVVRSTTTIPKYWSIRSSSTSSETSNSLLPSDHEKIQDPSSVEKPDGIYKSTLRPFFQLFFGPKKGLNCGSNLSIGHERGFYEYDPSMALGDMVKLTKQMPKFYFDNIKV